MNKRENWIRVGRLAFLLALVLAAGAWIFAVTESEISAVGKAGNVSAVSATITVNTTDDEYDAAPNAFCSLREAIHSIKTGSSYGGCTNPGLAADTISVPEGTYVLDYTAGGDLEVNSRMTIQGAGPGKTVISTVNTWTDRVFAVRLYGTFGVTMTGMTIQGGDVSDNGGGIHVVTDNSASSFVLEDAVVRNNQATGNGGGVYIEGSGPVLINRVAIVDNNAGFGAGIHYGAWYSTDNLTMINTTIAGNYAQTSGGGLYLHYGDYACFGDDHGPSKATAMNVTFEGNNAGTGSGGNIYNDQSVMTLKNTIVSGGNDSSGSNNCDGNPGTAITSLGYNIDSGDTCGLNGTADLTGTLPLLGPLGDYGGGTFVHRPQVMSPAVDNIPSSVNGCGTELVDDQRLASRPWPLVGACDSGAVEVHYTTDPIVVTTTDDENDVSAATTDAGRGIWAGQGCSLREEIQAVNDGVSYGGCENMDGSAYTIVVPQGTYVLTQTLLGSLYCDATMMIQGAGPDKTVISTTAAWTHPVFDIYLDGFEAMTMTGMTIQGGHGWGGGGIDLDSYGDTSFKLEDAVLRDNVATSQGGGLAVYGGGSTLLNRVAIVGNEAGNGGGIYYTSYYATDLLQLINVTVSDNSAQVSGGGLYVQYGTSSDYSGPSKTTATNVTIAGNSCDDATGGNIYTDQSMVTLKNTIVSGGIVSGTANNCAGNPTAGITSQGYNLDSGDTCGLNGTADMTDTLPLLEPLADTGGATLSHRPALTSPVVNHIPATENGCGTEVDVDQRTVSRPQPAGEACDSGAVERKHPLLDVAKSAAPEEEVASGDLVTYTILLSNSGEGDAEDVALSDKLPAKVAFARWLEQPAGASVDSGGELTWQGTVTASSALTFAFQVTFTGGTGDVVTNTVVYTHTGGGGGGGTQGTSFAAVSRYAVYLPVTLKNK